MALRPKLRGKYSVIITLITLGTLIVTPITASAKHRYNLKHDTKPSHPIHKSMLKDAVPRVEPKSKYGNPSSYVVQGHRYWVLKSSKNYKRIGYASWYGQKFAGFATSNHETYNPNLMTAASRELPLPTYIKVTNLKNKKTVIVRVNDRGPFNNHRIIDLSYAAALKIDMLKKGTAKVKLEAINPRKYQQQQKQPKQLTKSYFGKIIGNKLNSSWSWPHKTSPTIKPTTITKKVVPTTPQKPHYLFQLRTFDSQLNAKKWRQKIHGHINLPLQMDCTTYTCTVAIGPLTNQNLDHRTTQWLLEQGISNPAPIDTDKHKA